MADNKEMKTLAFSDVIYEIVDEKARNDLKEKIPNSEKGKANGVASLDNNGKVHSNQLPEIKSYDVGGEELGVVKNGGNVVIEEDGTMNAPETNLPLQSGEAKNSIQQLNNTAIGNNSVAFGKNNVAGCKGYYIKSIDTTNKKIYLCNEKVTPVMSLDDNTDITFETPAYEKGDTFLIINKQHYFVNNGISSIQNNVVTYTGDLGFTEIIEETRLKGHTFSVPAKPTVGLIAFNMSASAEGEQCKASGENSHAEGWNSKAQGCYGHAEGYDTRANWSAHSEGYQTYAYGSSSHAEGTLTIAEAPASHAEGIETYAKEEGSHAEGFSTMAIGIDSHAEGYVTRARGKYSHAEGYRTASDGEGSHAEGYYSAANKDYSHAEGNDTVADGEGAHAEGFRTKATNSASHAEGTETQADGSSHAEGYKTKANTLYGHAEGSETKAIGHRSHAEGNHSEAHGEASHAEGYYTKSIGLRAHSQGCASHAEGTDSHAEGYGTKASGSQAHAEGSGTEATKDYSHSEGLYTLAHSASQHVQGRFNIADAENKYAHIVGNGTSNTIRSNAHTVTWEGQGYFAQGTTMTGADYAEYFEWLDGNPNNEDRIGLIVTLNGDKIKLANASDNEILGIISGTAAVLGDNYECEWNGKYLTDEFGRIQYEEVEEFCDEVLGLNEETKELIVEKKSLGFFKRPILNPDYDSTQRYINRADRPEWDTVGMLGKLYVRDDGTCEINGYATVGENGIATSSLEKTNMRVLSRVNENIVRVLLK